MRRADSAKSSQATFGFALVPEDEGARADALVRHRSPLQAQLEALEKEHRRLLAAISKKKRQLELNEITEAEAGRALALRLEELREEATALSTEIRTLFAKFLRSSSKRSGARQRKQLRAVLAGLEEELLLPPKPGSDEDTDAGADDFDEEDDPFSFDYGPCAEPNARDAGSSAPKPDGNKQAELKKLFRKLALALHPDHALDAEERERRTKLFQEVARAYECGDIARLLEVEQHWTVAQALESPEHYEARIAHLTRSNVELRRQLRALQKEDLEVRRRTAGVVSEGGEFAPTAEVDSLLAELRAHVAALQQARDFCVAYDTGKLSLTEFLSGPESGAPDDAEVADMISNFANTLSEDEWHEFQDLVGEMFAEVMPAKRAHPPAKHVKQRKRKTARARQT